MGERLRCATTYRPFVTGAGAIGGLSGHPSPNAPAGLSGRDARQTCDAAEEAANELHSRMTLATHDVDRFHRC